MNAGHDLHQHAPRPRPLVDQRSHALFLAAGTTIQIDQGKLESLQVQTCDDRGCYAGAPVTKDMLAILQKAEKLTVTFQDLKKQTRYRC
jgi:invasion protein IalB